MAFKKTFDDDETPESQDFERLLNESFTQTRKKLNLGDKIKAEVLSIGKEQTIVSTGSMFDGFVPTLHLLNEEGQLKVKCGDFIDLYVTSTHGSEIHLSPNPTARNLAEDLNQAYERRLPVEGRVESVNKGGFEVLVMGKKAFCPVSQIDLKFVEDLESYVGKKFEFHITQFSEGGRKVTVSRRRLLEDAQKIQQSTFRDERKPGDMVMGVVTRLEKFGAFVEIAPGLEGLAHISELSWARVANPKDVVEVGQAVSAKILRIETENGRLKISLSLKQSENEPWRNFPSNLASGSIVSGRVTRCMAFGAFVELHPGIEGLIPLSEMSFTKRVSRGDEILKEGETIQVKIKDIDTQAKRISLSLKEAGEIPGAKEAEDFKDYKENSQAKASKESFGSLAEKMQAAMDRSQSKKK